MKYLKYLFLVVFIGLVASCNDDDNDAVNENRPLLPKKELRGVWVATAWGIDWPMGDYNADTQKQKYIDYLDLFAENNINAVFFQIRGMADMFYDSQYESWSKNLTGIAGQNPGYDVLKFLVEEAHKRGIQFHAWLNPYRISTRVSKADKFAELDSKIPAELTKDYEKIRIYNPALPEVQTRIVNIVKEIITKYDVDGIHLDDYFYPSLEASEKLNDELEYNTYGKEQFASIEDFRRNNVNVVVKNIQKAIMDTRPDVIYSISPAGNNTNNYNTLFADVVKWSQEGWVDVIIPQLYTTTGVSETSFNQRLYWWSQFTYKNSLMVGYGIYKFGDPTAGEKFQTAEDLLKQFEFAGTKYKVQGSVLYRAQNLVENKVGIMDVIKQVYKKPVLLPYLGRNAAELPAAPTDVKLNGTNLSWSAVPNLRYAVYKSNGIGQVADLVGVTQEASFQLASKGAYFVTAISSNNAESELSKLITY
ncbi:family 10 glycosylhydrolase [Bacteroides reticulotermitis]|uniref:glycoside hydrolase family 10 protein n=1 Tax=Bacteroides reticulotermitis TaxID=1133319 RepID=UPI003A8B40D5